MPLQGSHRRDTGKHEPAERQHNSVKHEAAKQAGHCIMKSDYRIRTNRAKKDGQHVP